MAGNRITWQNVDAPDLLGTAAARVGAGDSIRLGLENIGNFFTNTEARQRGAADTALMAKLMGVQSVEQYDALAKGGDIFGALGVAPWKLSDEAVQFATGYRDRMEGDRTSDLNDATSRFAFGETQAASQREAYTRAAAGLLAGVTPEELAAADGNPFAAAGVDAGQMTDTGRAAAFALGQWHDENETRDLSRVETGLNIDSKTEQNRSDLVTNALTEKKDQNAWERTLEEQARADQLLFYSHDEALTKARESLAVADDTAEGRVRNEAALVAAQEIAVSSGVQSPEEADRIAREKYANDPLMLKAVTLALADMGAFYTPAKNVSDPTTVATLTTMGDTLRRQKAQLAFEAGVEPLAKLYMEASEGSEGYGNPIAGVIERLGATVSEDNIEAFGESKADVENAFDTLVGVYPEIPPAIIAKVMENTLQGYSTVKGFIWNENVEFDNKEIRAQLDQLNTPEGRNDLAALDANFRGRNEAISKMQTRMDELSNEIRVTQDKPDSPDKKATLDALHAQVQELYKSMGTPTLGSSFATEGPLPTDPGAFNIPGNFGNSAEVAAAAAAANPAVQTSPGAPGAPGAGGAPVITDPNLASIVDFNAGAREVAGNVGGFVDQSIGTGVAGINLAAWPAVQALGYGTGLISPTTGASILNFGDQLVQDAGVLNREGLVGSGALSALSGIVPDGEGATAGNALAITVSPEAVETAQTSPMGQTLQEAAQATGMPPEAFEGLSTSLAILQDEEADPAQQQLAKSRMARFLEVIGRNGNKLPDDMIQRLADIDAWLSETAANE